MCMIVTIASWKGGTGKTTLTVLAAGTLALRGYRVLVIDADSNCAISQCFGCVRKEWTSKEFLEGTGEDFKGIYPVRPGIDIIPSSLKNNLLNNIPDIQLRNNIESAGLAERYDFIFIDPPGYWGAHTRNAVFAADKLIITGTCSPLDFDAADLFLRTIIRYRLPLDISVCVNEFDVRTNLPGIYESYKERFADYLIDQPIPCIRSLKRLTMDTEYRIRADIRQTLDKFVDVIDPTGGKCA
ncbi:hypothetical protein FACS1894172_16150 [Spirochaetia bacterium]|nr:hypothetical protein FACS1894172_16150 [Spirochaetia bacterium]